MEFINLQRKENLLIIKGVHRYDIFEEAVTEMLDIAEEDNIYYDKLPLTFDNVDNWPVRTNLCCAYDGDPFDSVPVFIPLVIRMDETMQPLGCFCDYPCAVAYIINRCNYDQEKKEELMENICKLYKLINMNKVEYILPAGDLLEINKYGGDMTIEQWREKQKKNIITNLPI